MKQLSRKTHIGSIGDAMAKADRIATLTAALREAEDVMSNIAATPGSLIRITHYDKNRIEASLATIRAALAQAEGGGK